MQITLTKYIKSADLIFCTLLDPRFKDHGFSAPRKGAVRNMLKELVLLAEDSTMVLTVTKKYIAHDNENEIAGPVQSNDI